MCEEQKRQKIIQLVLSNPDLRKDEFSIFDYIECVNDLIKEDLLLMVGFEFYGYDYLELNYQNNQLQHYANFLVAMHNIVLDKNILFIFDIKQLHRAQYNWHRKGNPLNSNKKFYLA